MEAIDVLGGIDGVDDGLRVDMRRQRELDEDAVNGDIGIEPADQRQQLRLARRRGEVVGKGGETGGSGLALLVADIDLACRIVADENDGKPRRDPGARHLGDLDGKAGPQALGGSLAVYDRRSAAV